MNEIDVRRRVREVFSSASNTGISYCSTCRQASKTARKAQPHSLKEGIGMNKAFNRLLAQAARSRNPFIDRSLTDYAPLKLGHPGARGFGNIGLTGAGKSASLHELRKHLGPPIATRENQHWAVCLTRTQMVPRVDMLTVMDLWDRRAIEIAVGAQMPEWRVVDTLVKLADRCGKPSSILLDSEMLCQDLTGWAYRNDIELRIRASACPSVRDPAESALRGLR